MLLWVVSGRSRSVDSAAFESSENISHIIALPSAPQVLISEDDEFKYAARSTSDSLLCFNVVQACRIEVSGYL